MTGNKSYWGREATGTDVWTEALERTRHVFDTHDSVVVSFSGGKDSSVVLHLAIEVAREMGRLPVEVIHFDEEAVPYETERYVRMVANWPEVDLKWWCLPIRHRNACSKESPFWSPWAPEDEDKWVRPLPPEALTADDLPTFPRLIDAQQRPSIPEMFPLLVPHRTHGNVACIQGIRAQESLTRLRAVTQKVQDNYIAPRVDNRKSGAIVDNAYPIFDWSDIDVWTWFAQSGAPYNEAYDIMEMAGVPLKDSRCCPPFGEEPLASLWQFRVAFPDIWERLHNRVPGAATAARYSRTSLYAFGGTNKPEGISWPDFVKAEVAKWPPGPSRRFVAGRIREWIEKHYRETSDPILESSPHPLSGISWRWLTQTAQRGDFKERRQPPIQGPAYRDEPWRRYQAELAKIKEEDRMWEIGK